MAKNTIMYFLVCIIICREYTHKLASNSNELKTWSSFKIAHWEGFG